MYHFLKARKYNCISGEQESRLVQKKLKSSSKITFNQNAGSRGFYDRPVKYNRMRVPRGPLLGARVLNSYVALFMRDGKRERALVLLRRFLGVVKKYLKVDWHAVLHALFFYHRRSWLLRFFVRSGRHEFYPAPRVMSGAVKGFFMLLKKLVRDRSERVFLDKFIYEIFEGVLSSEARLGVQSKQHLDAALGVRMQLHLKTRRRR